MNTFEIFFFSPKRDNFASGEKGLYHPSIHDYVILSNLIPPPLNLTPLYQLTPQQSLERTLSTKGCREKKKSTPSVSTDGGRVFYSIFGRADAMRAPRKEAAVSTGRDARSIGAAMNDHSVIANASCRTVTTTAIYSVLTSQHYTCTAAVY